MQRFLGSDLDQPVPDCVVLLLFPVQKLAISAQLLDDVVFSAATVVPFAAAVVTFLVSHRRNWR